MSARGAAAVEIHAVDVELADLFTRLTPPRQIMLERAGGARVTGRLSAPSHAAGLAALAAAFPSSGIEIERPRGARGRHVDLDFQGAPVDELVRLLADVGGINAVMRPQQARVSVKVFEVPWDAVLDRIARELGLQVRKRGRLWHFVPPDTVLPSVPRGRRRVRIDVDLNQATAAETVDVVRAVTPLAVGLPCDGGEPVSARLRNIDLEEALGSVAFLAGVSVAAGPGDCGAVERHPRQAIDGDARLVGIAGSGTRRAAIFRPRDGDPFLVRNGQLSDGYGVTISTGNVSIQLPDGESRDVRLSEWLHESSSARAARPDYLAHPERWRVAATFLDRKHAAALLESQAGESFWFPARAREDFESSQGGFWVEVERGRVVFHEDPPADGGDARSTEIALRPR